MPDAPQPVFLPGVPVERVLAALEGGDGDEIGSGKLASPESSAALAVNAFGWFIERPALLPPLPGLEALDWDWPELSVDLERRMRFPWRGGRAPNLDAAIETGTALIGVESKRYEPFRDAKRAQFRDTYWRPVWGDAMGPFEAMRDRLCDDPLLFKWLDAAQLVKHAFGLFAQGRRVGKQPWLFYLFAEPETLKGRPIADADKQAHREEIAAFGTQVAGAEVGFAAASYREWLSVDMEKAARDHAGRLLKVFKP